jgi:DNA-binding MarR family transcriptional regulator
MGTKNLKAPVEPTRPAKQSKRRESVRKWSRTVIDAGFTIIPTVLFKKQDELGLKAVDINILMQLSCHWWKAENLPYLSKETMAKRIGVDPSTIRRHIAKMQERGLLMRVTRTDGANGQRSNYYDLRPLVEHLHPHAVKAAKAKKRALAARRQSADEE